MIAEKIRKISIVSNSEKNPTMASTLPLLAEAATKADLIRSNGEQRFQLNTNDVSMNPLNSEADMIITDEVSASEIKRALGEFGFSIPLLVISTLQTLDFDEQTTKEQLGLQSSDKVISIDALLSQSLAEILDTYFGAAAA